MSRAVMTVEVDCVPDDPLGVKEAACMALEALGRARVTSVRIVEPEQLRMGGGDKGPPKRKPALPPAGQAAPRRQRAAAIDCCQSCAEYLYAPGPGPDGKLCWGTCRRTGQPVYDLIKRCGAWRRAEG